MPANDDMGLIADSAITELGQQAKRVEEVAFALSGTSEAIKLVAIAEHLRDAEEQLRRRISALARAAPR